eukprot:13335616-Heterocapsa_arctica.AAC.1
MLASARHRHPGCSAPPPRHATARPPRPRPATPEPLLPLHSPTLARQRHCHRHRQAENRGPGTGTPGRREPPASPEQPAEQPPRRSPALRAQG